MEDSVFVSFDTDRDKMFFLDAKTAICFDCVCMIIFTMAGVVFLKRGNTLVIGRGERIDFKKVSSRGIGKLLVDLVNVAGVGRMIVNQVVDQVELVFEKTAEPNETLAFECHSILRDFLGVPFRKKTYLCEKCVIVGSPKPD